MDLTKKITDTISASSNQDDALDLSAKTVNSQSATEVDMTVKMVSANNEEHKTELHPEDIVSSEDQKLECKNGPKVQLNIPHFERSHTFKSNMELNEKDSIKERPLISNAEMLSVQTTSRDLGSDTTEQISFSEGTESVKDVESKTLLIAEEKNSNNTASNSSTVNENTTESSVELEVISHTVQETIRDFSQEIAHDILEESKSVLEPMDHTDALSSVDDITCDVPTPGTPINKVLERVASEIELASTAGEDSNISFASETSRDEDPSDSNTPSQGTPKEVKKKPAKRRGDLSMLALNGSEMHDFGADKLYEYRWPQDREAGNKGDWYMLQEQVSDYLGVKSFKRKYPDLERRAIEPNERVYLREQGWVTEMQCDLGLTAIRSDVVHDLMSRDYPEKYKEFLLVLKERRKLQAIEKQKELAAQKNDKSKLEALKQKAMKSAAEFNSMFNRERREERRAFFDVHTFEVQYPTNKFKVLGKESTKMGAYPVALIPGQFQDNYKRYSPEELRYLPINTAMYSSPRKPVNLYGDLSPLSDDESQAESVSTEASDISESLVESGEEEMDSDIFREDDIEDDEDAGSQGPGKTKEEKKAEIANKVQTILEKMKEKESTPTRRVRAKTSGTSTPVEQQSQDSTTPRRRKRKAVDETSDISEATPNKTPRRRRKPKVEKEKEAECSICNGNEMTNPLGEKESLVQCAQCKRHGHPSCLELTAEMIPIISTYDWQCMECKSCVKCKDPQHEDKMLFCDHCDRGYHTFCVGLAAIPNGRWECPSCRPAIAPSFQQSMAPVSAPVPSLPESVVQMRPLGVTSGPPV